MKRTFADLLARLLPFDWVHDLTIWWYWHVSGWPTRRRCPECGGVGKTSTEVSARYGDAPWQCSMCQGTGLIPRH